MSDPLRIAFVTEGITDFIMLKSAVKNILGLTDFEPVALQPELSELQQVPGETGFGWSGVFRWCRQSVEQSGGRISENVPFETFDLIVVQLDADVADKTYHSGRIDNPPSNNLPCARHCPPPSATTNALRRVLLGWMNETTPPSRFALCTPSKALETWVAVVLLPNHTVVRNANFECRSHPEALLAGMPASRRLVVRNKKQPERYRQEADNFHANWPRVVTACSEAKRFDADVRAVLNLV